MTLEKLEARQKKELAVHLADHEKRFNVLKKNQQELVRNCIIVSPKAHSLLKSLLKEQHEAWQEMEEDDLSLLKHIHSLERESFLEKEKKMDELAALLSKATNHNKERGR